MPSGTMAQQIAARIWSERSGRRLIGMHPTCHLELHEERGYSRLHDLQATLIGPADRPMSASDLASVAEPLAAVIVELPTRENGGRLPPWDDLVELCATARDRGTAVHLDGARLWEAAAGYDRPLPDITELFDSTYVSFYKGIGALPGIHSGRAGRRHRRGGHLAATQRRQPPHHDRQLGLGRHAPG